MSPVIGPVLSRELVSRRLSALRWLTRNAATPTYTAYTCTCARAFAFARVPVKNFSTLESLHWLGNGERVSFCLVVRFETNDFVFWYVRIFDQILQKEWCIEDFPFSFCLGTNDFENDWARSFRPCFGGKFGEFWGKEITRALFFSLIFS